jgi:predicted extracellular nuclease
VEGSSTPVGHSLQLTGSGSTYDDFTWSVPASNTFGSINTDQIFSGGVELRDPVINEFVFNHTSSDTHEYLEIYAEPAVDYSSLTLLEIEGDSSGAGKIDGVFPLGSTNTSGYWFAGFFGNVIENGSVSVLLVENFSGSVGDDLDTDNDGILDSLPWDRVVDDIAVYDGGGSDRVYASVALEAYYDGQPYAPGGASRIPNGFDSDSTSDWMRNDFDGVGLPGFVGTQEIGEAFNTPGTANEVITVTIDNFGLCTDPALFIHAIQGAGDVTPELGNIRVIEAVVVGDFEESDELRGFFVQEEDNDADSFLDTSEGIFVYNNGFGTGVSEGDIVRVRGTITEYYGMTELTSVIDLSVCSSGADVTAAQVILPVLNMSEWEAMEGMLVHLPQELFVTENYTLGRYGEVDLAVGGRLFNPTHLTTPGAAANAQQALNDLSRIQLDDGNRLSNKVPIPPYFAPDGTLRAGDSTLGIMGVLAYDHDFYEVHPVQPVDFVRENDRTGVPDVGGDITVASFNVLNYFTTFKSRGAYNAFEFDRQRDKIIAAVSAIDADVVGLIEIENNATDAIEDLIDGLNAEMGAGTYAYIDTGVIGTDEIRVALIYRPATVSPVGSYAVLNSSFDPDFIDSKNRPVLAQTFADNDGAIFTVAVNHLKSKGSACDDVGDPDMLDGQGNCNLTRKKAAQVLVAWLATDPTGSGDTDVLIIGDLNSYADEDPIVALETAGYTDLLEDYHGSAAYSYVFMGQAGYLDYSLVNPTIRLQVTGADVWHINADEPTALDYKGWNQSELYSPDPYRSSDHDPVIVGLNPNLPPVCDNALPSVDLLWPANHKFVSVEILGVTDPDGDAFTVTIDTIFQDELVDDGGDGRTWPDGQGVGTSIAEVRAERAADGNGRVYHITFTADDGHGGTCSDEVLVGVPHDSGKKTEPPVDDGPLYDSTLEPEAMIVPEPTEEPSDKDKKDK